MQELLIAHVHYIIQLLLVLFRRWLCDVAVCNARVVFCDVYARPWKVYVLFVFCFLRHCGAFVMVGLDA